MSYTCPMHPEITGAKNETCQKCGMHLVPQKTSLKKVAFSATFHCLTGCAVGEILGMIIGTHFNIYNTAAIVLSIILAFVFGYSFTLIPLLKSGISFFKALSLAFAADTVSITVMEIVDNLIMVFIPGALDAGLNTFLFWGSLAISLFVAFWSAYPVNMYLIAKGKGHAVVHNHH
jgi:uncharacterized protein DUF4396/heavy metal-binding protein